VCEEESVAEFRFDREELLPLVEEVVHQVLKGIADSNPILEGRLAFKEKEAADLLGLNHWQLRDLRRAGNIDHSRIVGRQVRYTIEDLQTYLRHGHQPGINL